MSLYCFFHAWYSMVNSYALTDVLESEPNPNFVPRPEGLELSFNMTRKLSVIASKLNKCLKKYEKNVTVDELYP